MITCQNGDKSITVLINFMHCSSFLLCKIKTLLSNYVNIYQTAGAKIIPPTPKQTTKKTHEHLGLFLCGIFASVSCSWEVCEKEKLKK